MSYQRCPTRSQVSPTLKSKTPLPTTTGPQIQLQVVVKENSAKFLKDILRPKSGAASYGPLLVRMPNTLRHQGNSNYRISWNTTFSLRHTDTNNLKRLRTFSHCMTISVEQIHSHTHPKSVWSQCYSRKRFPVSNISLQPAGSHKQ